MAGVSLENVSRVYAGGVRAVDGLSLEIRDKEFLVLVGPSGCGKTTTLRMIAGLETLTSGQIRIGGQVVNDLPPRERNVAMVFQNFALNPNLTVARNLALALELRQGVSRLSQWFWRVVWPPKAARVAVVRQDIAQLVERTAQLLGIEPLLGRLPSEISGGERQRAALARAIVRQPAAFLLDEPLSNLDAKLRVETRRKLKRLHRQLAATVLYVTHDQAEATALGDRIAVMDQGRLQQVGTAAELYERPRNQFVAGFIGTPPMNFLVGELASSPAGIVFRSGSVSLPISAGHAAKLGPQKQVMLGVRPEDVVLVENDADAGAVAGRVSLIEPLGDETAVAVDLQGLGAVGPNEGSTEADIPRYAERACYVTCKLRGRTKLSVGDEVRVRFSMDRAHFFGPSTGENLLLSPEE